MGIIERLLAWAEDGGNQGAARNCRAELERRRTEEWTVATLCARLPPAPITEQPAGSAHSHAS